MTICNCEVRKFLSLSRTSGVKRLGRLLGRSDIVSEEGMEEEMHRYA